jgi:hypothetical protein
MAPLSIGAFRMTRRHDTDALRVLAFGRLILYHAGMLYVAPASDWGYTLKSGHLTELCNTRCCS